MTISNMFFSSFFQPFNLLKECNKINYELTHRLKPGGKQEFQINLLYLANPLWALLSFYSTLIYIWWRPLRVIFQSCFLDGKQEL